MDRQSLPGCYGEVKKVDFSVHVLIGMNFDAVEAAAIRWLESHDDFQLVYADENENQLQFTCNRPRFYSFFIVSPASTDGNWVRVYSLQCEDTF